MNLVDWLEFLQMNTPDRPLNHEDQIGLQMKVFQERKACPFLIDGECSIYPVRPLMCRTHQVDQAPELCESNPQRTGSPLVLLETRGLDQILKTVLPENYRMVAFQVGARYFRLKLPRGILVEIFASDGRRIGIAVPDEPCG